MDSGIYKITNTENGKIYIGQATNLKKRFRSHRDHLKAGTHVNKCLQNDFNTYGANAFKMEVIEYTKYTDRQESIHCYENDVWNSNVGYNIGEVRDYRVISFNDSIELGERILTSLINKNPQLFELDRNTFEIPIKMIAEQYKMDSNVIYIALSEGLKYTDVAELYEGWTVSIDNGRYLNFFNNSHFENSIKSVSFF